MNESNSNFNPYYASAKALDMFRDNTIYGKTRSLSDLDNVGATFAGSGLNTVGNAAIASGNPLAMAGGFIAKGIGGTIDAFSYNPRFDPIDNSYSNEKRNVYDLGGIKSDIDGLDPKSARRDAQKQMGLLGITPLGFLAGARAKKKARQAKEKAMGQFNDAQDRFNTSNENYFEGQAADMSYNQRQMDRMNKNVFNIRSNFYDY